MLAGCGTTEESGPAFTCPQVVAIPNADRLTRFAGPGRDLTDVGFEADIAQLAGTCGQEEGVVDVALQIRFLAVRGPADEDRRAPFGYFVAIADKDQNVVLREPFETVIEFQGNATRAGVLAEIERRFPLAEGKTGADYVVYVGFALTHDEYEYNSQHR